jgi:CheY-like chemotaxis protein
MIQISTHADAGDVVIRISDNGVGMPRDFLPVAFEPFRQGEQTLERAQGGLGIGLTLVRQITEAHGGTVIAESDGIGQGSTFVIRLPMSEPVSPPPQSQTGESGLRSSSARRVLVVEDNIAAARMLQMVLKSEGHEAALCHSGMEAYGVARSFRPDVVLLDIGLPGKNGYDVAKEMRADDALRGTLLVALSGYDRESDRDQSKAAGIDHHLAKPVSVESLRSVLAGL